MSKLLVSILSVTTLVLSTANRHVCASVTTSATAFVFGERDIDQPPLNTVPYVAEATVDWVPGALGQGYADTDFRVGAFGRSESLGIFTSVGGSGSVGCGFVIVGNPQGKPLPLRFIFRLDGSMEIVPLAPIFSAADAVTFGVGVTGVVVASGTASFASNHSFTELELFGDFRQNQFDTSFDTDPQTVDVNAIIRTQPTSVTNSGILSVALNTSAVAGNANATSDFLNSLTLDAAVLSAGFSDPDVDVSDLFIQFDCGAMLPISVEAAVVPEPTTFIVWSFLAFCGIGLANCRMRRR